MAHGSISPCNLPKLVPVSYTHLVWQFIWERVVIWQANHFKKHNLFAVDIANTGTNITALPEFTPADVIHLDVYKRQPLFPPTIHGLPFFRNRISGHHNACPVSYTHLDVYKRQGIYPSHELNTVWIIRPVSCW